MSSVQLGPLCSTPSPRRRHLKEMKTSTTIRNMGEFAKISWVNCLERPVHRLRLVHRSGSFFVVPVSGNTPEI